MNEFGLVPDQKNIFFLHYKFSKFLHKPGEFLPDLVSGSYIFHAHCLRLVFSGLYVYICGAYMGFSLGNITSENTDIAVVHKTMHHSEN